MKTDDTRDCEYRGRQDNRENNVYSDYNSSRRRLVEVTIRRRGRRRVGETQIKQVI